MRRIDENIAPATTATAWRPITLRGEEAMLLGTMKTVKTDEATATTIAVLRTMSSTSRMTMSETVGMPLWKR